MKKILTVCVMFTLFGCQGGWQRVANDLEEGASVTSKIELSQPAEISFISPPNGEKEVLGKASLNFLFKKSVFPVVNHQAAKSFLAKNVTISPEQKGEWKILGTTGISFEPREEWRPSTKYSLKFSPELLLDFSYNFSTPVVRVSHLETGKLVKKRPLKIFFNQEVALDKISRKIKVLNSAKEEISFDLKYGKKEKETSKDILELVPRGDWIEGVEYFLTIEKGVFSQQGNLPMDEKYEEKFKTLSSFSVVEIRTPEFHNREININFSADVSSQDLAKSLEVKPEIPAKKWTEYLERLTNNEYKSRYFYLPAPGKIWNPATEYTIIVNSNLKDVYGRSLSEKKYASFKTTFSPEFRPLYSFVDNSVFPQKIDLQTSFIYSGRLGQTTVFLNKQIKKFNLESSQQKRQIWDLNLLEEFPEIKNDQGLISPGQYKFKIETEVLDRKWPISFEANFFISDFAVEMKKMANNQYQIWANPYPGDENLAGNFSLEVYVFTNRGNDELSQTFDQIENGFTFSEGKNVSKVVVKYAKKVGYGGTYFNQGMNPWDANISYEEWAYKKNLTGTAFTDRPLYKPGQTLFYKGFFRKLNLFGKNFPLKNVNNSDSESYKITIYDAQYNKLKDDILGKSENGSFDGEFKIPADVGLGVFSLNVENEDGSFSQSVPFWVQEYRKPNFLISAKFDQTRALYKDNLVAKIKAQYAFGGDIVNKPVEYVVSLFGYEQCDFWCWWSDKKDKVISSGEAILDENGELEIAIDLNNLEDLHQVNWNLLTINANVKVSSAEVSSVEKSIPFFVADREIELSNLPYFFGSENSAKISGKIFNLDKKEVTGQKVNLKLVKTKWVRNDRKNSDGKFYKEWEQFDEEVWSKMVKTDNFGKFYFEFNTPEEGGKYAFIFSVNDEEYRSKKLRHSFWVSGSETLEVKHNETNKILQLYPNKDEYEVGEKIEIFVPNSEFKISRAHATIERGEVLEELDFNLKNNTLSFEAKPWMSPNVYVSVLIEGQDEKGYPKTKWGAQKIKISDTARELKISVNPAKKVYKPGEEVELKIKSEVKGQGASAEVALAIVDQTLLALKSRVKLDLMESLLGELPLGVATYSTLANFVSTAEMEEVLEEVSDLRAKAEMAFGGGGGKGNDFKPRGNFKDTAKFLPTIKTDKNGEATVKFTLPDNLTTWNIWAVGATADNSFGDTENDFQVSLPLLISEIVPNFFQAGDEIKVGLLIHRNDNKKKEEEVTVKLNLPPELKSLEKTEKKVSVEQESRVFFPLQVSPLMHKKTVKIGFEIQGEDGQIKDAIELQKDILPPSKELTAGSFGRIDQLETWTFIPAKKSINSALKIKVFSSLANYLENLVEVAEKYNYYSTEQQFSVATAQLYRAKLDKLLNRQIFNLDIAKIKETREKIEKSFVSGGGFSYWEKMDWSSFWVTTQILTHADLWSESDLSISSEKLENSAQWLLKETLKTCPKDQSWQCPSDSSRNNAAYALSKYGKITVNELEFLSKYTNSLEAQVWWLKTAQNIGNLSPKLSEIYTEKLEIVKQSLVVRDRYAFFQEKNRDFYSQDERLTAIIFELFMSEEILPDQQAKIAKYLSETKKDFISTNSAMYITKSLASYVKKEETAGIGAKFIVENHAKNEVLLKGTLKNADQVQLYENDHLSIKREHKITVSTDKPLFVETSLTDSLPAKFVGENSRGFWINREIFALTGKIPAEKSTDNLEVGKNYLVKLKITTNENHRQVVVEDPILSGAEIVNFELENSDKTLVDLLENNEENGKCLWGWCVPLFQHKEYRYDRARFFIDNLKTGTHEINYILKTRLPGKFEWLPAQVREMYYPEIFANTAGREIEITE